MKQQYERNIKQEYERLRVIETLELQMNKINIDFATYFIDPIDNLFYIFLYPTKGEFTAKQIIELKKAIEAEFHFQDEKLSKKMYEYERIYHRWVRDFRENEGTFLIKRYIRNAIDDKYELMFLIENAPKMNCKLIKKKVQKVIYEAICK